MKKLLFGIFAHPDDEAFGPCGMIVKAIAEGTDVHLIALTCGESGQNPDQLENLGQVREAEWRAAGECMGATSLQNLYRPDGHLDNIAMQEISIEVEAIVRERCATYSEPFEAEFLTLDPNGLTGHIDHIVAARAATFVFYKLKTDGFPLSGINYYCNSDESSPSYNIDWIYADKGHSSEEISKTIDAREYRDEIIQIMQKHHTQRQDYQIVLSHKGENVGLEHFLVQE